MTPNLDDVITRTLSVLESQHDDNGELLCEANAELYADLLAVAAPARALVAFATRLAQFSTRPSPEDREVLDGLIIEARALTGTPPPAGPAELQAVAERLSALLDGATVTVEYPGWLEIDDADGGVYFAGTSNATWCADYYPSRAEANMGLQPDAEQGIETTVPSDSPDVEAIAQALASAITGIDERRA